MHVPVPLAVSVVIVIVGLAAYIGWTELDLVEFSSGTEIYNNTTETFCFSQTSFENDRELGCYRPIEPGKSRHRVECSDSPDSFHIYLLGHADDVLYHASADCRDWSSAFLVISERDDEFFIADSLPAGAADYY